MLRSTLLAVLAIAVTSIAAYAADLPAQTRLGAIFGNPRTAAFTSRARVTPMKRFFPRLDSRPRSISGRS